MDSHRSLIAWRKCQALGLAIYRITKSWPADERFGLTSQLRRAAVSSSSNVAEGYARRGAKELRHFLGIALGSLAEIDSLLSIAQELGYLEPDDQTTLEQMREEASKTTYGLMRSTRR